MEVVLENGEDPQHRLVRDDGDVVGHAGGVGGDGGRGPGDLLGTGHGRLDLAQLRRDVVGGRLLHRGRQGFVAQDGLEKVFGKVAQARIG